MEHVWEGAVAGGAACGNLTGAIFRLGGSLALPNPVPIRAFGAAGRSGLDFPLARNSNPLPWALSAAECNKRTHEFGLMVRGGRGAVGRGNNRAGNAHQGECNTSVRCC